jgi:hypothetical protein
MMNINKVYHGHYHSAITGNGGEECLMICSSWGQHGKTPVVMTRIQCDGTCEVFDATKADIPEERFERYLINQIGKWAEAKTAADMEQVHKAVKEICEHNKITVK